MPNKESKPIVALMGEFSAGKSTLTNLLIGEGRSPVKVTATQLPPVWFSFGPERAVAVDLDGTEREIALDELAGIGVADTSHVRVFLPSEILELMDLIDMPGNSDPNMSPEVWQRMVHHADGAIWCTHATQAWRQSEAAVWDEMPEAFRRSSILLLTRFDKIRGETDRARVMRRVTAEAGDAFHAVFPVSLLQAIEAGDDRAMWEASGVEAFLRFLLEMVTTPGAFGSDDPAVAVPPQTGVPAAAPGPAVPDAVPAEAAPAPAGAVLPRRVAPSRPAAAGRGA